MTADMAEFDVPSQGVFPSQWLEKAVDAGLISGPSDLRQSIQPASVDLHLGETAYRLRCSFLPGRDETVEQRLEDLVMGEVDLTRDGAVLEVNRPYLIPLAEELRLAPNVWAKANPKSSTGRVDVLTRVVTDHNGRFDEIAAGYNGRLYVEVVSNTFTIKVHPGLALNQLRLMAGRAMLTDEELREAHKRHRVLWTNGQPVPPGSFLTSDGFLLGLELETDDSFVGYRAKKNSRMLDLSKIGGHDPDDYWDVVTPEGRRYVILEPQQFYLLLSAEAVGIPPEYAGEMVAYDPTSGELRTHYAGFFDPGFGYDRSNLPGSQAALEVRAHDVPFMVQPGQPVCKIVLNRLIEPADRLYGEGIGSNYQGQQSTLSKYFRRPAPKRQLTLPTGP
jgi:dCTP deaminase